MISCLVYIEIFTLSDFREHASNRTDVKGKNVVVSGAGTIGNLVAQFCKARECGIADTLNITKRPLKEAAKELFGDEGYQVGFEVAGVESSIRSLMETIEKGSDIVVVAVFAKDPALSMFHLGEHELRLIGSMMIATRTIRQPSTMYRVALSTLSLSLATALPSRSTTMPTNISTLTARLQ